MSMPAISTLQVEGWYTQRALTIDSASGLLPHAIALLEAGLARGCTSTGPVEHQLRYGMRKRARTQQRFTTFKDGAWLTHTNTCICTHHHAGWRVRSPVLCLHLQLERTLQVCLLEAYFSYCEPELGEGSHLCSSGAGRQHLIHLTACRVCAGKTTEESSKRRRALAVAAAAGKAVSAVAGMVRGGISSNGATTGACLSVNDSDACPIGCTWMLSSG